MISTINTNKQSRQKRKLEHSLSCDSTSSSSSSCSTYFSSSSSCSSCNQYEDPSESPRTKMRAYETELRSFGYYSDPIKPNLYTLSSRPGMLEVSPVISNQYLDSSQIKRTQKRVFPISPSYSLVHHTYLSHCNLPMNSNNYPSNQLMTDQQYQEQQQHQHHHHQYQYQYQDQQLQHHHLQQHQYQYEYEQQQQQQQDQEQDYQENDEEFLLTLASITSYDDNDFLDAVFLHFNEE